jgi:hypothetical protein
LQGIEQQAGGALVDTLKGEGNGDLGKAGVDPSHVLERWQDQWRGALAGRFLRHAQTAASLPQVKETIVALAQCGHLAESAVLFQVTAVWDRHRPSLGFSRVLVPACRLEAATWQPTTGY